MGNRLPIVILAFLISATFSFAEQLGAIKGRVLDQATKQPLVGVNVFIVGTTQGTSSTSAGEFAITDVKEDVYKLRFSLVGYRIQLRTDVRVVRNKATYIETEMVEDAVQADEVVVNAGSFELDKQAPVSKYTYTREEINRSPGAAGDLMRAIETLPGVSSSGGEFSAFSVRGASPRDNIVLVDNIPVDRISHFDGGVNEEQEALGGRFSVFAPNLIEEAQFQAGGFPARFGGKHAALVNMKMKQGNRDNFTMNGTYDLLGWEFNYDGPTYILPTTAMILSARHQDFRTVLKITDQKDLGDPDYTDIIPKQQRRSILPTPFHCSVSMRRNDSSATSVTFSRVRTLLRRS